MTQHSHVQRLSAANTVNLHCGKLGTIAVGYSAAQGEQAKAITGQQHSADAIAALVNRSYLGENIRFEAMDSEFERGSGRRKGSLYLQVLGEKDFPVPLRLQFNEQHTKNAEELLAGNERPDATQAGLVALVLSHSKEPIRASAIEERSVSRL